MGKGARLYFPLNEYIFMYFQITGAIYMGGAGAAIIGGLYWKRGTAGGAWAAMIVGCVFAVSGILLRNIIWPKFLPDWKAGYPHTEFLQTLPEKFPFNGMQMSFFAACAAIIAYIVVTLLFKSPPANMDKLLHRGEYSVEGRFKLEGSHAATLSFKEKAYKRLGITDEFTRKEKFRTPRNFSPQNFATSPAIPQSQPPSEAGNSTDTHQFTPPSIRSSTS